MPDLDVGLAFAETSGIGVELCRQFRRLFFVLLTSAFLSGARLHLAKTGTQPLDVRLQVTVHLGLDARGLRLLVMHGVLVKAQTPKPLLRNGDSSKNRGELPTAELHSIKPHYSNASLQ
jgi:hypothetical protein